MGVYAEWNEPTTQVWARKCQVLLLKGAAVLINLGSYSFKCAVVAHGTHFVCAAFPAYPGENDAHHNKLIKRGA
jgi:hypothetical protein